MVGDIGKDGPRRGGIQDGFHEQGMDGSGLTLHVLFKPGRRSNGHGRIVIAIVAASGQGFPWSGTLGIVEITRGALSRSTRGQVQARLGILSTAVRLMRTLNDAVQQDTRQMTEGILERIIISSGLNQGKACQGGPILGRFHHFAIQGKKFGRLLWLLLLLL